MATKISGIIPILALGLAAQLPCHAAPATDAQSAAPSSAQLDALIEDIKAHKEMCDKVDPGQAEQVKQCSNEQAALVARQKRLGVSNATVNAKLKTRGWRWP